MLEPSSPSPSRRRTSHPPRRWCAGDQVTGAGDLAGDALTVDALLASSLPATPSFSTPTANATATATSCVMQSDSAALTTALDVASGIERLALFADPALSRCCLSKRPPHGGGVPLGHHRAVGERAQEPVPRAPSAVSSVSLPTASTSLSPRCKRLRAHQVLQHRVAKARVAEVRDALARHHRQRFLFPSLPSLPVVVARTDVRD